MKTNIILAALYAAFTALSFILSDNFPENAGVVLKIWYIVSLIILCIFAARLLSLSIKLCRRKKTKQKHQNRKENKK